MHRLATLLLLPVLLLESNIAEAQLPPATTVAPPPELSALENSQDLDGGSFCLTDLSPGMVTVGNSHLQPDGVFWWDVRIHVDETSTKKPKIYFFSKSRRVDTSERPVSCADSASSAFVRGTLTSTTIDILYRPRAGSDATRWLISRNKLDAQFNNVEAHLSPLFGGSVIAHDAKAGTTTLTRRQLKVTNPTSDLFFNSGSGTQSGTLDLATTDVQIAQAKLALASTVTSVDLACRFAAGPNDGRVHFQVDVTSGNVSFAGGECSKQKPTLPSGMWRSGGISLDVTKADARSLTLVGGPRPNLRSAGLVLDAKSVTYEDGTLSIIPSKAVTVHFLRGPIVDRSDALEYDEFGLDHFVAVKSAVTMGKVKAVTGTGDVTINRFDNVKLSALIVFSSVKLPALDPIASSVVSALTLNINGTPSVPEVSGSISFDALQLAILGFPAQAGPFAFKSSLNPSLSPTFDFNIVAKPSAGVLTIGDPNGQSIKVSAKLNQLRAKGTIVMPSETTEARLSIEPNSLAIDATASASTGPIVLGSPVSFVGSGFSLSSKGGFSISKSARTGTIDLTAQALIFANANLAFANPDAGYIIQAPVRTQGAATIRFDSASSHASLDTAHLTIDTVVAHQLDTAKTVELGGISLASPDLSLGHLQVDISNGTGSVSGGPLKFSSDSATHADPPYWHAEFSPGQGLSIPTFSATVAETERGIVLKEATISGLNFSAASAEYRDINGLTIGGSNAQISADKISQASVTNGAVSIGSGVFRLATTKDNTELAAKAVFSAFSIRALNGGKDSGGKVDLSGSGSIHISNVSVDGKFVVPISSCGGNNGFKLTGAVDIDALDVSLNVDKAVISGSTDAHGGKMYVVNDGESGCGWDQPYIITNEVWADVNFCPPFSCNVKTIIVPAIRGEIYWEAHLTKLDLSASIQQATFSIGNGHGTGLCFRQLALNPPIIIASYTPTIRVGGFIGDFIHNEIQAVAAASESTLATMFSSQISFATYVSSAVGTICTN